MQRLLRGRFLYLLLGGLTVVLYLHGAWQGPAPTTYPALQTAPALHPEPPQRLEPAWDRQAVKALASRDRRVAAGLSLLTLLIAGIGVAGLILGLWGASTGRLRVWRHARPGAIRDWSVGEAARIIALTLLITALLPFVRMAALSWQPEWERDRQFWMPAIMLLLDVFVTLTILTFASRRRQSSWAAFGVSRGRAGASVAAGLRDYLVLFPWLFGILFLSVEIARAVGYEPPLEPIHELIFKEHRPPVLGLTVLLACVAGPVAEEGLFRGVLYGMLRHRIGRQWATLASAALFALVHTNPIGFVPILLLGCFLADLYERTKSLAGPLIVHVVHNTLLMGLALAFRFLLSLGSS